MNLFNYTYDLVRQIPAGMVSTYGAVAEGLGDKIAARAVGYMMNQNPNADTMPCYKIVQSDGKIGGFGLGIDNKKMRLKKDNIMVEGEEIVDFNKVVFRDFTTEYPLKKLRQEQIALSKKIVLKDNFDSIQTVAGIDVAYPKNAFEEACGACVVLDYISQQIIEKKCIFAPTSFPYISTYFFYREFPIIQRLLNTIKNKPTITLFDGNGILHPYRCGLASQCGLLLDIPTIGVAKRLLYGTMKNNIVTINNEPRGYAFISSKTAKTPIFVSPGHHISLKTSLAVVQHLCRYKIPEPLRQAHMLATNTLSERR